VYEVLTELDSRGRSELYVLTTEPVDGTSAVAGAKLYEVPVGRFGFTYKKGHCVCGATAQSKVGKLVDAELRPPIKGREAR